jgi:hypothetical protein
VAFLAGFAILRLVGAVPVVGGVTWVLAGAFGLGAGIVAMWSARGVGGKHRAGRTAVEASGDWIADSRTGDKAAPALGASTVVTGGDSARAEGPTRDEAIEPEFPGPVPEGDAEVNEEDQDWTPLVPADAAPEVVPETKADRSAPAPSSGPAPRSQP